MTRPGIILTTIVGLACLMASPVMRAQAYDPVPVTVSTEKITVNGKVYLSHVVQQRQTLYSIAKAYGVGIDDIYAANPTLSRTGLLNGSTILIPVKDSATGDASAPEAGTFKEHLVKWYETMDDIARLYGMTVKELMEYNHLESTTLTRGQRLFIPMTEEEIAQAAANPPATEEEMQVIAVADSVNADGNKLADAIEEEEDNEPIVGKTNINMGLVLPFNTGGRVSGMNMDFYAGVLLALRDLQAEGIYTHLSAYDIKAAVPSGYQLNKNDFVLGPISGEDLVTILDQVNGGTTIVSPLDQKAIALRDSFPNFIQAPSFIENQYLELAQWLSEEHHEDEPILLMSEKDGTPTCSAMRDALDEKGLSYEVLYYNITEGSRIPARLATMMKKGIANRVIVASENEAFVSDAMRNLSIMNARGYKVISYGTSKLRLLDAVDNNYYHETSLHLTTAYYVDYEDERVNKFILSYRALYNTEPSQFSFQGYDTAYYFISKVSQYGDKWTKYLDKDRVRMLHLDFLFNKHSNGSLSNGAIRRVIYMPDMSQAMVE